MRGSQFVRALLVVASLLGAGSVGAAEPMGLLVPAYFYPEGKGLTWWANLASAARKAPVMVILNPDSGPGTTLDTDYLKVVQDARAAGARVIGYVYTLYGARPLAQVTRDINLYRDLYPVDGIFIDEMANAGDRTQTLYYSAIYQYVKALDPKYTVVSNPGTDAAEIYMSLPATDLMVNFEWTAATYKRYQPPAYMKKYGAARSAHLIHDSTNKPASLALVDTAAQRGAGWIYVTNDRGTRNPWDSLPGYWTDLVRKVCQRNGSAGC